MPYERNVSGNCGEGADSVPTPQLAGQADTSWDGADLISSLLANTNGAPNVIRSYGEYYGMQTEEPLSDQSFLAARTGYRGHADEPDYASQRLPLDSDADYDADKGARDADSY